MAKLTVYIPDDLLDRARTQDAAANTSQLVQRGLERLVGVGSALYAQRPADAEALLASARDRLAPAAEEEFQCGYRAALTTVDERFWPLLDQLSREGFDLQRWARAWIRGMGAVEGGFSPPDWWKPLAKDLGSMVDPIGFDETSHVRTTAFTRGYEAALRDAWSAIEHAPHPNGDEADQNRAEGGAKPA